VQEGYKPQYEGPDVFVEYKPQYEGPDVFVEYELRVDALVEQEHASSLVVEQQQLGLRRHPK
jgi:hypothetical protein